MVEHIVGGNERRRASIGKIVENSDASPVIAAIKVRGSEIKWRWVEAVFETRKIAFEGRVQGVSIAARQERNKDLTCRVGSHIFKVQCALAFDGAALAERQEPAQAAVGGAVSRKAEQAWRVGQIEAGADDEAKAGFLGGDMRAHHA